MILYHFTSPANAFRIAEQGLQPCGSDETLAMVGEPVVWLTRQPSNIATAADVAHMRKLFGDANGAKEGALLFGGTARLTVSLEPQTRLVRYRDIINPEYAHVLTPDALANWYAYFGTIPPRKIIDASAVVQS
jgi:hypothetical protein